MIQNSNLEQCLSYCSTYFTRLPKCPRITIKTPLIHIYFDSKQWTWHLIMCVKQFGFDLQPLYRVNAYNVLWFIQNIPSQSGSDRHLWFKTSNITWPITFHVLSLFINNFSWSWSRAQDSWSRCCEFEYYVFLQSTLLHVHVSVYSPYKYIDQVCFLLIMKNNTSSINILSENNKYVKQNIWSKKKYFNVMYEKQQI